MDDTYKVIKYAEQMNKSRAVAKGMWAVIRVSETVVAFTETEAQAKSLVRDLTPEERETP